MPILVLGPRLSLPVLSLSGWLAAGYPPVLVGRERERERERERKREREREREKERR